MSARGYSRRSEKSEAYPIQSTRFLSGYSDSGTITVYAGIRAREVERVLDLVYREIRKRARHGIDGHELKRTQDQMKGSLMLSLESSHSRMNKLAKDELIAGTHTTLDDLIREIDGVTEQQVFQIARNLLIGDNNRTDRIGSSFSRQWRIWEQNVS